MAYLYKFTLGGAAHNTNYHYIRQGNMSRKYFFYRGKIRTMLMPISSTGSMLKYRLLRLRQLRQFSHGFLMERFVDVCSYFPNRDDVCLFVCFSLQSAGQIIVPVIEPTN